MISLGTPVVECHTCDGANIGGDILLVLQPRLVVEMPIM